MNKHEADWENTNKHKIQGKPTIDRNDIESCDSNRTLVTLWSCGQLKFRARVVQFFLISLKTHFSITDNLPDPATCSHCAHAFSRSNQLCSTSEHPICEFYMQSLSTKGVFIKISNALLMNRSAYHFFFLPKLFTTVAFVTSFWSRFAIIWAKFASF